LESFGKELEKHRSGLYKRLYLPDVKAFPKVRELFERIKSDGKLIALASSSAKEEADYYKHLANIEDLVEAEVCSEDVENSKPAPDVFTVALRRIGRDSHDVLVVGDTPYDAEAAAKSNLRSVGVLCGGFAEQELLDAGTIAIFRDPEHLLARYDNSPLVQ